MLLCIFITTHKNERQPEKNFVKIILADYYKNSDMYLLTLRRRYAILMKIDL